VEELARDIAIIEPDPQDWGWLVSYLLEELEEEAKRYRKCVDFSNMIISMKNHLEPEMKT